MTFVRKQAVDAMTSLTKAHYTFPRAAELRSALELTITDYYAKAASGGHFEARGVLVTGPSRIGKTTEIRKLLDEVNSGTTIMPDGRAARIVSVMLNGRLTWKDLGFHTLREGLGFPQRGRATQREVWDYVLFQAREQGVIGIHYDECQHIVPRNNPTNRAIVLDSFKSLLKQPDWPLILILSGVNELRDHLASEEQLAYLLRPVTFSEISISRTADLQELHQLCHAYAERLALDFSALSSVDFYRRLVTACANRWGLVIELLVDAIVFAIERNQTALSADAFCAAFTRRTGLEEGFSPFSISDYEDLFRHRQMSEIWERRLRE